LVANASSVLLFARWPCYAPQGLVGASRSKDLSTAVRSLALLRQLAREKQSAVIVVTHDRRMVEGFDRRYLIEDGRLVHRQDDRDESGVSTMAL
jgi:predicted ABC-type transport system involved in lysophospholipase L1 biosynthesis ATPase subunit